MNAPNATKPIITSIRVARCNDRIQIDLMDFRAKADGDYKWVIQIKDHFSRYVWLHPLVAKESKGVATIMHNWFMYNGCPKIIQCDNGTEFKRAQLNLCGQFGIKVINGAPFKPSTQGSVESANPTFKRRLQALQTERGVCNWAYYLPEIALAINTTRPYGLKKALTPYLVHFGRLLHWESVAEAVCVPLNEDDDGDAIAALDAANALQTQLQDEISAANLPSSPCQPLSTPRVLLPQTLTLGDTPSTPQHIPDEEERNDVGTSPSERSEIEAQQAKLNEAAMERMIGRSISTNAVEFKENQVVSLKIFSKLRLAGEFLFAFGRLDAPTDVPSFLDMVGFRLLSHGES